MVTAYEQLDKRFAKLKPLTNEAARPSRGWIRAIREALGMTTGQLAKRLGVHQPRVIELERGEATGNCTVKAWSARRKHRVPPSVRLRAQGALGRHDPQTGIGHRRPATCIRRTHDATGGAGRQRQGTTPRVHLLLVEKLLRHRLGCGMSNEWPS